MLDDSVRKCNFMQRLFDKNGVKPKEIKTILVKFKSIAVSLTSNQPEHAIKILNFVNIVLTSSISQLEQAFGKDSVSTFVIEVV